MFQPFGILCTCISACLHGHARLFWRIEVASVRAMKKVCFMHVWVQSLITRKRCTASSPHVLGVVKLPGTSCACWRSTAMHAAAGPVARDTATRQAAAGVSDDSAGYSIPYTLYHVPYPAILCQLKDAPGW